MVTNTNILVEFLQACGLLLTKVKAAADTDEDIRRHHGTGTIHAYQTIEKLYPRYNVCNWSHVTKVQTVNFVKEKPHTQGDSRYLQHTKEKSSKS